MSRQPLVSVIVSTYNRDSIISETIDSILRQSYVNFELLVISDGSTDSTIQILNGYSDSRLRVFDLQYNCGLPGKVRNYGLTKSRGEYVAFCDDDDIWLPNKLEVQIEYLENRNDINLIATNAVFFPGCGVPALFLLQNKRVFLRDILRENMILTPSVIVRKAVLLQVGFFDEDQRLRYGEDLELWIRILNYKNGSILVLRRILVQCRLGNNKISQEKDVLENIARSLGYIDSKLKLGELSSIGIDKSKSSIIKSQKSLELSREIALNFISTKLLKDEPLLFVKIYTKIFIKRIAKFLMV